MEAASLSVASILNLSPLTLVGTPLVSVPPTAEGTSL